MSTETVAEKSLSIKSTTMLSLNEIVADTSKNSRWEPVSTEKLHSLAASMAEMGNVVPVLVRRVPGNKSTVEVIDGFTRYAAATLITEGFDYTDPLSTETRRIHIPDFKLKVALVVCSDDEFLDFNVVGNKRNELSPMDHAKIVRLYQTLRGLNTAQIAQKLGVSLTTVINYDLLNRLSDEHKREVHSGQMAFSVAVELAKLSTEKAKEVVAEAKTTGKKVSLQSVKDARREQATEKGTGERVARTIKQLRLAMTETSGPAEFTPIKTIAETVMGFVQGATDEKQMKQSLTKACKVSAVTMLQFLAEKYDSVIPQGVKYEALAKACMDWEVSKRQEEV